MNTHPLRRTLIAGVLIAASTMTQATPRDHHESTVRARVISSQPIFQTINEPRTECWTETVSDGRSYRQESNGGAVIGAIAGGLLGSTVGKGNGRIAAAAVGAATGAVIGDRIDTRYDDRPRQVERCQTTDTHRQVISGYNVRYHYQGQDYHTRLPYEPGRYLKLRVSVAVDERSEEWSKKRWNHRDDDRDDRDEH